MLEAIIYGIGMCLIYIFMISIIFRVIYCDFDLSDLVEWFIGLWKKKRIPKNRGDK